jgi:hypothetical protein
MGIQNAKEVDKEVLEYPELKLVHKIRDEHLEWIEAEFR